MELRIEKNANDAVKVYIATHAEREGMSMGAPGDHPITDLIVYGQNSIPEDIAGMLRMLHARDPKIRDVFAMDAFDWADGRNLEEGRVKLKAELDRHGLISN